MLTSKRLPSVVLGLLAAAVLIVGAVLTFAPAVRADAVVFLTRIGTTISVYPRNNAFLVGTTTPTQGGTPKLGVFLNVAETYTKAFEIASTTGNGTATTSADIFLVKNTGCIQAVATSTATPIKLTFNATTTQGSTNNGVLDWAYGTCP